MKITKTAKLVFKAQIVFLVLFALSGVSFAEESLFIKEYTYQADPIDNMATARIIAAEQVKKLILDKLSAFLLSETEVKGMKLTQDKVSALAAGAVAVELLEDEWDGKKYHFKAKIKADKQVIAKNMRALLNDEERAIELYDARARKDYLLKEAEKVKSEFASARGNKAKQAEYVNMINSVKATDWFVRGNGLYIAKEIDPAVEAYTKAIGLDPNYAEAYNNLGNMYNVKRQYQTSISNYNQAISLNPKYSAAYYNRGLVYSLQGQLDRAIEDYSRAITLSPGYFAAYNNRGIAYKTKGQYDKAISDYNKALSMKSDFPEGFYNRGNAYLMKDQYDAALTDFNKAISIKPDYAYAFIGRGSVYMMKRQYDEAIENYNKSIAVDPDGPYAYYYRGNVYRDKGLNNKALPDYKKACQLGYAVGCEKAGAIEAGR